MEKKLKASELKARIEGFILHEMTHVWQWYGDEAATHPPAWLVEGIADCVPLSTGYKIYEWVKPGTGNKWNENTAISAAFLTYCNEVKFGFVPAINKMMQFNYVDDYFERLTGCGQIIRTT
ncbi:hypothetical protein Leryth_015337 [Lithospermum erythrorhizon]|nr:hypothetical protein Leryth_015337 [Lithospermum erythrorhizon]